MFLHFSEKRRTRAQLFLPVLDRPSTLQVWYGRRFVEVNLQLSSLSFFLMSLILAKHKLDRVLTNLPLSVSSALTDGGQPGVQQIPAAPALPGVCQVGFSLLCVSVAVLWTSAVQ